VLERADPELTRMELVTLAPPGPVAARLAAHGIEVRSLGKHGLLVAFARLARLLARERYDVAVAYGFKATTVGRVLVRVLSPSTALVCGVQALHVSEFENLHGPKARFVSLVERIGAPLVNMYEANSRGALDLLASLGIPPSKLHYIPSGIDAEEWPEAVRPGSGTPTILCVARFVARKRHQDLIEAARMLAAEGVPFRLAFAGDGPRLDQIRRSAADLGDRVSFLGAVGTADLAALYGDADVFCLPSAWEGMAGSVLEAMATGLPVVGTAVNGIADLVVADETGLLVPSASPSELADALRRLLVDPELRTRLGRAARRRVEAEFPIDRTVTRKQELYRTVANAA
jgi:glycosyltransferase involved in cell wall biosynthesis